jgi:hypothetical protein
LRLDVLILQRGSSRLKMPPTWAAAGRRDARPTLARDPRLRERFEKKARRAKGTA